MTDNEATRSAAMNLYVAYRDFITVDQVAVLLGSVNKVYSACYAIEVASTEAFPDRKLDNELRIGRVETGNSITFDLLQGAQQVIGAVDPILRGVAGGTTALALAGRILIHGLGDTASRSWYDHQTRALALREQMALVQLRERTADNIIAAMNDVQFTGTTVDLEKMVDTIGPATVDLTTKVLNQPNIVRVTLNGQPLVDRSAEER